MKSKLFLSFMLVWTCSLSVFCESATGEKGEGTAGEEVFTSLSQSTWPRKQYDYHPTTELAAIDESKIERVIYVNQDHPKASNRQGSGTTDRPYATIAACRRDLLDSLNASIPTKLVIAAGIYREDLTYFLHFRAESEEAKKTMLVMEGEGEVIISGARREIDGVDFSPGSWKKVPGADGLYMHDWPKQHDLDPGSWINTYGFALLPGLLQRAEMIWIDDVPLRQVLIEAYRWDDPDGPAGTADYGTGEKADHSNVDGRLVFDKIVGDQSLIKDPGTFGVFESTNHPAAWQKKIAMRLPAGKTLNDVKKIEVSNWVKSYHPLFLVTGKENLLIRNIRFNRNTSGALVPALKANGCKNFIIDSCDFSDNVAAGLQIDDSSRVLVRNSTANHNGGNGMGVGGSSLILFEDCETSYNNYRGGWAGMYGWHPSGFKSGGVKNMTVRRHTSIGNYANGIWFDVYCKDVLVEDSFFLGNVRMGVMFELTKPKGGPHVLRNSVLSNNDGANVFISMASNTRVEDNILLHVQNTCMVEEAKPNCLLLYKFRDHPTGSKSAADWQSVKVSGNIMAGQAGHVVNANLRKSDPRNFDRVLQVMDAENNQYWIENEAQAFFIPKGSFVDFTQWIETLTSFSAPQAEIGSVWEKPDMESNQELEFTSAAHSAISEKARSMGVPLSDEKINEYWKKKNAGMYLPPYLFHDKQFD